MAQEEQPLCRMTINDASLVQSGLLGIQEGFHHADHGAGDKDLVAHLGVLAHARSTHAGDIFSHQFQKTGSTFLKTASSPPTMMASGPLPCPYITARDRGIE